jgi:hypothetical protein
MLTENVWPGATLDGGICTLVNSLYSWLGSFSEQLPPPPMVMVTLSVATVPLPKHWIV